jgi:hypothetical protein
MDFCGEPPLMSIPYSEYGVTRLLVGRRLHNSSFLGGGITDGRQPCLSIPSLVIVDNIALSIIPVQVQLLASLIF